MKSLAVLLVAMLLFSTMLLSSIYVNPRGGTVFWCQGYPVIVKNGSVFGRFARFWAYQHVLDRCQPPP